MLSDMYITPDRAADVTLAACALHNYLRKQLPAMTNYLVETEDPNTHEFQEASWRANMMQGLQHMRGNTGVQQVKKQRDELCEYVNGTGKVTWQRRIIGLPEEQVNKYLLN